MNESEMEGYIVYVPPSLLLRFDAAYCKAKELPEDLYTVLWDDLVTALENRIKVLKK